VVESDSLYFFSLEQKVRLPNGMAVYHFRVLRKLTLTDRHARADRDRFQTQTLEKAEAQDGVAADHLAYEHLLVVHLEDLDRKVFHQDRESYPMPDVDVHFVLFPSKDPATSWCTWVYGAKLWKAQTTQDVGILQLTALFKTLSTEPDWLVVGPHDADSDSSS
jgi:hypothetical protein